MYPTQRNGYEGGRCPGKQSLGLLYFTAVSLKKGIYWETSEFMSHCVQTIQVYSCDTLPALTALASYSITYTVAIQPSCLQSNKF